MENSMAIIDATFKFSGVLIKANIKSWKMLIVSLGLPVFMLLALWLPAIGASGEDAKIMDYMFPGIIMLAVMLPGQGHATRLTTWKQLGVYKRLLLTPLPISSFIFGAAISQIVMGVLQGTLMIFIGFFIIKMIVSVASALLMLGVFVLASAAFIAFGSLIAAFSSKSEMTSGLFFLFFLPIFFLGSFPDEMLPEIMRNIIPWLPTEMAIDLIGPLITQGVLPENMLFNSIGLILYTVCFSILGVKLFKVDGN